MASNGSVAFLLLLFVARRSLGYPQDTKEEPDDCIPKPPDPKHENEDCCPLSDVEPTEDRTKAVKECMETFQHPPGSPPPPPKGDHPPPPHHPPPPPHHPPPPPGEGPPHHQPPPEQMECIAECIYNKLGLLTTEMKLNNDELMKNMINDYGKDEAWKPVVEGAVKTCTESSPGEVSKEAKCKSGAAQFGKCFNRTLFKDCPSGVWKDTETCNAKRELINKCKNQDL